MIDTKIQPSQTAAVDAAANDARAAGMGGLAGMAGVAGHGDALVLDAEALANLASLDPTGANQLLQRVLVTYRGSMARLLAQLTLARSQADLATLRLVTHTLKSSSASVGALAFSMLCAAAEQAVREGHLDQLPPLLDQIEAEASRVDAAILQLLSVQ